MLMNQVLGVDSAYIWGKDNDYADSISRMTKDDITSISKLF